jgi:hypothetical protein
LFRLSLSWYHILQTQTSTYLILSVLIEKQWCIQSLNFQRKKKFILANGMWSILLLSQRLWHTHYSWKFNNIGIL